MGYRDKIYKNYLSSGFREMNTGEFEKISESYGLNYNDLLPCNPNIRILDIGCGMGHFLYYLKKRGFRNFLGIDIGPEQVDYCLKNISENVERVEDVFEFLDKHKNYFDLVVMNDVLEHFGKGEAIELLSKIFISLSDKGRLIIKTLNMGNLFAAASFNIDLTHETGFSEISLQAALRLSGFKKVNCRPEKIYITSKVKGFFFRILRAGYMGILRLIVLLDRPGDNYPKIFSKNLISWADK